MNRAMRWYTVVTLLYDLCSGLAIFDFKWEEGWEQITLSSFKLMTLMKIAFTGGQIFTRRSFHRRGVRIGRPNFDVVIATPKNVEFWRIGFC